MALTRHFQPGHVLSERGKCKVEGVNLPVAAVYVSAVVRAVCSRALEAEGSSE